MKRTVGPWNAACRKTYRESVRQSFQILRFITADGAASDTEARAERWAERQIDRLDRLYLNTTMSEREYSRLIDRLDRAAFKLMNA